MTELTHGPGWSSSESHTYAGRFPLSVERHTMTAVDALVPGVTTVTLNAQYYALHGLVADHAQRQGLTVAAAQDLLRRTEVAMCAISASHMHQPESDHPQWLSQPHGYNVIRRRLSTDAVVDLPGLAASQVYAQPKWGFLAAYRGSEMRLQILSRNEEFVPGERWEPRPVREGLEGLIDLASQPSLAPTDLESHERLCLCRMVDRPDGKWLARLFAAPGSSKHTDQTRHGTLQMLTRAMLLSEVRNVTSDVTNVVCFDPTGFEDKGLNSLTVVPQWRGLMLRNLSVKAWRDLWAWLVNGIDGLSPRSRVESLIVV